MYNKKNMLPYFTWGCADDLTGRLKKTLYCSDENDCYQSSSVALTDVAVSMFLDSATCSRRKLTHRYASSLTRQLPISPCALMMGILYSERLRQLNSSYLERVSSSDLYVVSMLVATKFLVDEGEEDEVFNDEWAEAAGLAVSTMNKLERDFLDAMDWNIYVTPPDFLTFCTDVETRIALKYGLQRGWFSYTDLTQFFFASRYQQALKGLIENTVKIIGGCALIYGMSLSLLATSIICYTAPNTARHISKPSTTSAFGNSTPSSYETFSNRRLTRQRKQLINLEDQLHTDDTTLEITDELALVLRNNSNTFEVSVPNVEDQCECKQTLNLCFEFGFHYLLLQTKLLHTINRKFSYHHCDNKMFDLDPGNVCNCERQQNKKFQNFAAAGDHHLDLMLGKLFYSSKFTATPTLFGMAVM